MSKYIALSGLIILPFLLAGVQAQEDDLAALSARGKDLYWERVSCWVCHGDNAEGRVGPSLQHGPTPLDIYEQLQSNPQMAVIISELNPNSEDLVALATYLGELTGNPVNMDQVVGWRDELALIEAQRGPAAVFTLSPRDKLVEQIAPFGTVLEDWPRRAKTGSLKREYDVRELATYDAGEPVFEPEPGKLYFYENTGPAARMKKGWSSSANSSQIVIGDARNGEIITYSEMPADMRGAVHTTVLTPDARYVYIVGGAQRSLAPGDAARAILRIPATLLKVDAMTLKPVKQLDIGGRLHHAQIFQDRYILMDTFVSNPNALDVFLLDPETDEILGGIRAEDLGGLNYTAWTDDKHIYVLMQPADGHGSTMDGAARYASGLTTVMRPYWVAKLDPETWEVLQEYPYRGFRGDWIVIDSNSEYLYVPAAANSTVTKINIGSGEIAWSAPVGIGPYGGTLNADETELWVANKGEASGGFGRTISVVDTDSGRPLETVFSGYMVDHVLLAPNGNEMWATSNGEGRIYVFDAETREQKRIIDMPNNGDPHGLVWVHYDDAGNARVVRDQGGFHNGVHPARGVTVQ